jgi:hypothetical protein
MEGIVYRVAQNGVEANLSSPKTHIVAFVDGDKFNGDCEPKYILRNSLVQIIVASPPEGAYQKWIEQTGNSILITKLATSLWSRRELFLTGLVLAFHLSTLD